MPERATSVDADRVIAELRELDGLTGGRHGARRVAWTDGWRDGRAWLRAKLDELPLEVETDEAGNLWATLRGDSRQTLAIGSHLDSVVGGGWLDGSLGVLSALAIVRRLAASQEPRPVTVRLVEWADEEGARFGRSLLGSSACSRTLDLDEVRDLTDADGVRLQDALLDHHVALDQMHASAARLDDLAAYLELHIEQGPVLERLDLPLAAVEGTCGAARYGVHFTGRAAHPAATPMDARHDALLAGARFIVGSHDVGARHGGITSIGYCAIEPHKMTVLAGECDVVIEQNHFDGDALAAMEADAIELADEIACSTRTTVRRRDLWRIESLAFNPSLVSLAEDAIRDVGCPAHRMPSGPLHDAGEVARAGIPAAMLFVRSIGGLSHNPAEDTSEADLRLAVRALDALADKAIDWIARGRGDGVVA